MKIRCLLFGLLIVTASSMSAFQSEFCFPDRVHERYQCGHDVVEISAGLALGKAGGTVEFLKVTINGAAVDVPQEALRQVGFAVKTVFHLRRAVDSESKVTYFVTAPVSGIERDGRTQDLEGGRWQLEISADKTCRVQIEYRDKGSTEVLQLLPLK
ncbi:hypothetical protein [Opitutus sp. ER46]|uniref:hypothetical protein n=1 Tax=Opitutus sp. ER46 TaxID=2161864 RepID=UPI000D32741B|nr:hypothetical protein [Opitutus sp. ER46]PTX96370.1 hypothetical protein DB354_06805 [Opitutus sp. ER46]